MIYVSYKNLCPQCSSSINEIELANLECNRTKTSLCHEEIDSLISEFSEFFRKTIGEIRGVQLFWARRILQKESFAAVAPTGIGKTSFGIVMSLFLATKGSRSYLVFPTTLLVDQAIEKIEDYSSKLGLNLAINNVSEISVLYYHGKLKKNEKEKFLKLIHSGEYSVLITTTAFLSKHFNEIGNETFDFIFVDDVDSILKTSRNVDRILTLLGFKKTKHGWTGESKGVLMVSTATAKKGQKTKLFRSLLNFDVGSTTYGVRNIEDIAINDLSLEKLTEILEIMGGGGLIYARNSEEAEKIYRALRERFRIGIVTSKSKKDYDLFERGEIDYLVGTAYYYGSLVRGLDLPERIRFVVFFGAPVFRVKIEDIDSISKGMLKVIALIFRNDEEIKKIIPYLNNLTEEKEKSLRKRIKELLKNGKLDGKKDLVIKPDEVIFPDIRTYIQGSGRASRLFSGGITKGASFLLEGDNEILEAFIERSRYFDIEFKSISQVNFNTLINEIDETRKKFRERGKFKDVIKPTLFIVESPTKAKQIARFFGHPSVKVIKDGENVMVAYEVPTPERILLITASLGHITDLTTEGGFHGVEVQNGLFRPIYASIKKCRNCGHQFTEEKKTCPKCGSPNIDDSKRRIEFLRKIAKQTGYVIIGTDPDAEGEKIAWDISNLLSGCGEIKRAEFHEITRKAVSRALRELRDVDENRVKSQIVRRIEDRWIGFVLSQKLWDKFGNRHLSAGRAQTPVLGWIIQRADEHKLKKKVAYLEDFDLFIDDLDKKDLTVKIELIERKIEEMTPLPPYTTDSLLRDSNRILKMSAGETMKLAQDLFENGLITYHRTDSTTVSEAGLRIAKEYLGTEFNGRKWEKTGAHECIRPTMPVDRHDLQRLIQEGVIQVENISWKHFSLYDLIFRRFMASQCKNFNVEIARYRVLVDGREIHEERVIKAEGRAFDLYKSVWVKNGLPEGVFEVKAKIIRVPKAPLYTQSDIVSLMKEKGIGRPSTYATIVEKLFLRKYIIERNGRLIPTDIGEKVFDYLNSYYGEFVSEKRTEFLEMKMDEVEKGEADYLNVLTELYREIKSIS